MDIDIQSIISKASAYMESKNGRKSVSGLTEREAQKKTFDAAEAFVDELAYAASEYLSGNYSTAVPEASPVGYPKKEDDNTYSIVVRMPDEHRESLDPERYPEGIKDMAQLLDFGMQTRDGHRARGRWHGKEIWGVSSIPKSDFMSKAVSNFMGTKASLYDVIDIEEKYW